MDDNDKKLIRVFERDETFSILRWLVVSITIFFWLLLFGVSFLLAVKVCFIVLVIELCSLELWKMKRNKSK